MTKLALLPVLFLSAAGCTGCRHESWGGPPKLTSTPAALPPLAAAPPGAEGPANARVNDPADDPPDVTDHPRVLLKGDWLSELRARKGSPALARATKKCDEASAKAIDSGYEGWDWGAAGLACAFLYRVSGDGSRAKTAVTYLKALLDDKAKVGDGAGGDEVVRHDSGYPIRTHGMMAALLVDWLHDAPSVDRDLRKHAAARLVAWTDWFRAKGYMRDHPVSNYYAGYFGAVALGGLALSEDDPAGKKLRAEAKRMYASDIVPAFAKLDGGGWPEGWQYGGFVAATLGLYAGAEKGLPKLPWLDQVGSYRAHALWPDRVHIYDDGDWSKKPAVANVHELLGVLASHKPKDPEGAPLRLLALHVTPAKDGAWSWLEPIASGPEATDDRAGRSETPLSDATSYFAKGTSTAFARTDWSRGAAWASFACSPYLADHQHLDAGHFELVRGSDPLLVDGGGYGAGSSLAHNVILVDDPSKGDIEKYAPNQTPERSDGKITRFEDARGIAYALGDVTSAYRPPHSEDDAKGAVKLAERSWIFSRTKVQGGDGSARLVIADHVVVASADADVTFAFHSYDEPIGGGGAATSPVKVAHGASSAWITTALPKGATRQVLAAPTKVKRSDGSFWFNDEPPEAMHAYRVEVTSPKGSTDRRFLHVITAGPAGGGAPPVDAVPIEGAEGVGAAILGESYVVIFSAKEAFSYRASAGATRHLVTGLEPNKAYALKVAKNGDACTVRVAPSGDRPASAAGVLAFDAPGCVLQ